MSASYFDLLKYAATGIASPDMTYYDRMRASALMDGAVQTLTGQPPLTFKADGTPLISWSMLGNGQQTGTPTPDNPVMPEMCGVRTGNVMPAGEKKTVVSNGVTFDSDGNGRYHIYGTATANASASFNLVSGFTTPISISNGGQGTLSFFNTQDIGTVRFVFYNGEAYVDGWSLTPLNRTHTAYNTLGNKYVDSVTITVSSGTTVDMIISPEFTNDGVLPSGFDPYGYKLPLTNAGQTVPVYLGEVPTVRRVKKLVLTGEETGWSENTSGTNTFRGAISLQYENMTGAGGLCSHNIYKISGISADEEACSCYRGALYFRISKAIASNVATFKQWLSQQYAAGHPVTVWYVLANKQTGIVNEPLCKISTYADELNDTVATLPEIPTTTGQNALTVETELQPSRMTITFKG